MAQFADTLDLATLDLRPGDGRSIDLRVRVQPVTLAGERYEVEHGAVEARVDLSRMVSGYALRLRFEARLLGTCTRCLDDAHPTIAVDAREVDQPGEEEDLHSPYMTSGQLDLTAWARDAFALALPTRLLCRDDCQGLCAVCGVNLNEVDAAEHHHDSGGDPRWGKLREWRAPPS
ncbi:MAG: DUF177 domain-containing protein [Solirubrobacterales bacterium]